MTCEELQKFIEETGANITELEPQESYQALSECLNACCAVEVPTQRRQAAAALANAYGKLAEEAMEFGRMRISRCCVQDCKKLRALFPEDEHITKNLVSCISGMAYIEGAWGKTDTVAEYMDEVLCLAETHPQSLGVQCEAGICMGSLIETCGCVKELLPLAYDGIERMKAVAERFSEDEELQTIYAHILVEGCKLAHSTSDTRRLLALLDQLQSLMDAKAGVVNADAVQRRLQNIGIQAEDRNGQEGAAPKETSTEQTAQNKACRELLRSIEQAAVNITGRNLAQSRQALGDCLRACSAMEPLPERRQAATALVDAYYKLAEQSMERGELFTSLNCVLDCREIHSLFPEDAHIAGMLLQCITGLVYVKLQQREDGMVEEYMDEVLELAERHPQSVEVQRQAAMCMGNLVALCGSIDAPLSLAYDGIERMEAVADRFPQDEDLQNVYAHILVSGCYFADRTGNAERLDQFRTKIRELEEKRADSIDARALRQHLAQVGLD